MNEIKETRKRIVTFLILTLALSAIFYFLIISAGTLGAGWGFYTMGLMWCPGMAAILTQFIYKRKLSELGWGWGKTRYQVMSYVTPLLYALVAYLIVWISGLGGFYNRGFVAGVAKGFGWEKVPQGLVILFYVLLAGIFGFIRGSASALGEEIGWRGFLVPQLAKHNSYTVTALVSGLIWAIWHFPILLFADYNSGTPAWYGLACFTVLIVSTGFIFAWIRLKSGSLWTAVFLHASHNMFIQGIFTPLTSDTGKTKYFIDEFGAALAVTAAVTAFIFWKNRSKLPTPK
jgi:membrane protease YdiL (CAAX protease family)